MINSRFGSRSSRQRGSPRPADLQGPVGPTTPVLERLDPLLRRPVELTDREFDWLVEFVGNGLLDPAAGSERLRRLIPEKLPSGRPPLVS
ncbi:MAG: hypothetical protein ACT4P7_23220 [Gemmatimonadaceae bacterium]